MKQALSTVGGWIVGIAIIGGLTIAPAMLGSTGENFDTPTTVAAEPECVTESIPYEEVEEETDNLDLDDWEIETVGEDGEREICTLDGEEVSNEITTEPVSEVKLIGTYEEPEYEYNDYGCPKDQYVSGYFRSNGTYVDGYYRNSPHDDCY